MTVALNILFIDDDDDMNFLHQIALERLAFDGEANVCTDVDEGLRFLSDNRDNPPDLVFLDINMPRRNGFELLEEYEKQGLGGLPTRFVMLSNSANPADKVRANQHPLVMRYQPKPLETAEMGVIIAAVTRDKAARTAKLSSSAVA